MNLEHPLVGVTAARRWWPTLALLVGVAVASPARADDEAEARAFFAQGQQAYESGMYLAAAQLFERAHQLAPRRAFLWNAAAAWDRQFQHDANPEHLRSARRYYREFAASAGATEKEKKEAGERIVAIDDVLHDAAPAAAAPPAVVVSAAPRLERSSRRRAPLVAGLVIAGVVVVAAAVGLGVGLSPRDAPPPSVQGGILTVRF